MLLVALFVVFLAGGGILVYFPDPFHWIFDAGLTAVVAGPAAALALGLRGLSRSRRRWARVLGITGWITAACGAVAALVLAADYRQVIFRPASPAAWRADLRVLASLLEGLPARLRERARTDTLPLLERFDAELDSMPEDARHARLAAVVASLEDGHSLYFPFFPASSLTLAPLQARFFDEGLYIVQGGGRHAGLRGQRILRINDLPVEQAYQRMAPMVSADNEDSRRHRATAFLLSPGLWHALGVGERDELALDIQDPRDGSTRRVLVGAANRLKSLCWYARPMVLDRSPWKISVQPDRSAVVVDFTRVAGSTRNALGALAGDVLEAARGLGAKTVVFDVRENSGGDNTLLPPLVAALAASEYNHPDRLYVLTGPGTFSAATNFVSLMERETKATLVGRPTGSGPNHHGDSNHVVLPSTRVVLFLSSRWHQFGDQNDPRRSHAPDIAVADSAVDFFNGRDPVLEAALRR